MVLDVKSHYNTIHYNTIQGEERIPFLELGLKMGGNISGDGKGDWDILIFIAPPSFFFPFPSPNSLLFFQVYNIISLLPFVNISEWYIE